MAPEISTLGLAGVFVLAMVIRKKIFKACGECHLKLGEAVKKCPVAAPRKLH